MTSSEIPDLLFQFLVRIDHLISTRIGARLPPPATLMSSYQVCKRTLRFPKLGGFEDPDSPGPGHYQLDSSSFVKAANAANQPTAAFGSNDR